jgi:hypothetical protein
MKNITDMTPAELGEVVKAETDQVMSRGCGIYPGMEVRHVKTGGDYTVMCEALIEATMTPAVVYRSAHDGKVWVRPTKEFCDGRFVGR